MPKKPNFLPQEVLKQLFRYDPDTGNLFWLINYGEKNAGDLAGEHRQGNKWFGVFYCKKTYSVPNLIWVLVTGREPNGEVDHKDRDHMNNRWSNLREATRSQNQANTRVYKSNSTGYRGVSLDVRVGRYKAFISQNGKNRSLGYFASPEEAHEVWKQAAKEIHGEFASV